MTNHHLLIKTTMEATEGTTNSGKSDKTNIIIRIDAETKEYIEQIAKKDHRPLAGYLRMMIAKEIEKHSAEAAG